MTLALTGATGQLGRLVVADLLQRGVPSGEIIAVVRSTAKAADLGVPVRQAAYEDPEALTEALAGVDRLLLISGSEPGRRIDQHGNVIAAAKTAGVSSIAYTSAPRADTTSLVLAPEHRATEEILRRSGVAWTLLRNNWYSENYLPTVDLVRQSGKLLAAAGSGRVASASRADFAAAAAVVLTTDGHEGATYELGGDTAWDFDELAAVIGRVLDQPITYAPVTPEERDAQLAAAGVDEDTRGLMIALDANIAEGTLAEVTGELSRLIGRPTTPLEDTLRAG